MQDIVRLAVRAETLGLDSVWASDHIFNVGYVRERIGNRPYYDPLTILTYIAAKTERIALGTSVLVLPYRHPMRLAKAAATLDVMSGGRLIQEVMSLRIQYCRGAGVCPLTSRYVNASNNALASCRSAVSRPSVNQP